MLRSLAAGLALGALVGASPIAVTGALAQMHTPSTGPGQPEARIEATAREVSRAPYQARLATTCPSGGNRCDFTGAVVASGRRLEIQRVACRGDHSPIGATPPEFEVFAYAERGATGAAFLVDLPEVRYSQTNTAGIWTISQEALMFIPAGYRLHMYNSATTGVLRSIGCTVSGYMVTLGV
jgi:hypothetical protein